ncbi:1D-myo-inositol 2-acetamido-2-deoxy-alpha-D-glucopyranoside deacetylase (Precursor) [Propionibacterium freudenreichii]|uniref:PIG-L family deacetylase n=1 Tax=Propionibacterium freudenreichii TaxID=1744 RepID=UPI000BC31E8A|nr:PIG-L family deacetylase [Propionibacterium freudenreichii]SBN59049.1 1D-myo-inositol 2-acetamido-2-deoxy-alpha-D-glucopyranoside deacetylase (Precursor) [Propionibacterium freudenreichii]SCQ47220.1 1D-myo-inositol 2-acetamido-2-deoxy-alpha-D-glucopyranoside deacetylase (Precursor) [Propionibacterium freudenreichii]SCQ50718.1 1D-myo-inositol 2-acetamido-2-deoxy-alpha-D-glucopyranoside deacetylase (Precursor) [Propionibacterium freudenreichii]
MSTAAEIIDQIMNKPAGLSLLVVHAHPDDETLETGPLIAGLTDSGARVDLLTCTRGERGEVVPGVLPAGITQDQLVAQRERELEAACDLLGVRKQYFLGEAPFRAPAQQGRHYLDSGMVWVTPTQARPAPDASPISLTKSPKKEEIEDLITGLRQREWSAVVSYDDAGSYGHPDHLRTHQVVSAAAKNVGIPCIQIVSDPTAEVPGAAWFAPDDVRSRDVVVEALRAYRTQLQVLGTTADGTESADEKNDLHIRHVGGQRQEIPTRVGLIAS